MRDIAIIIVRRYFRFLPKKRVLEDNSLSRCVPGFLSFPSERKREDDDDDDGEADDGSIDAGGTTMESGGKAG